MFIRVLNGASNLCMFLGGVGVFTMMVLVVSDVIGKYVFNHPIPGVLEIVAFYFMTMVAFLPLAIVQKEKGHIVIELFTQKLSPRGAALLNVPVTLFGLFYMGLYIWGSIKQAIRMTSVNQTADIFNLDLLIWPTRWILPVSLLLMMIWMVCQMLINLSENATLKKQIEAP
ncbi:MAG TPA: TRAP transporter small permease [Gammaproteobacteria bacterium]|nr:TRAP transporter small permease [Gammaproteobacteria bacterium]